MIREAVVAGMFYDKDARALKKHINRMLSEPGKKVTAKGIMVPHAGYVYSGKVAGEVFSSVIIPDNLIILGPNHTGLGTPISIMAEGTWRTPLGDVNINGPLAEEILKKCPAAQKDELAHSREHSIEVQLPFIQSLKEKFSFVPVVLAEPDTSRLRELAKAIAGAVEGKDALITASTDLTHYEEAKIAKKKDLLVLDAVEALDPEAMYKAVRDNDISMCGWMAVYVMLHACRLLGAKKGQIIKYMNSGDASGDYAGVVGYGGAVII